jgi:tetratricopeptide (TPR) repeat protein
MTYTPLQIVVIALIVLPALAIVLWPLLRGGHVVPASTSDDDRRLELSEQKASFYRALKELDFDHEAGHLSDDDYTTLRARYETQAAEVLGELDMLAPSKHLPPAEEPRRPTVPGRQSWTRHPLTLAGGGLVVLLFGVVIGLGVTRFAEPERSAPPGGGMAMPMPSSDTTPAAGSAASRATPLAPEMRAGMLRAARQSLMDNRYPEAIAAYQAVLKRDAKNVDALTHMGLIVAIGGYADVALETIDKALAIDPRYPPAYFYRGQVLFEQKQDYAGAVKSWQQFLALVPTGEDHDRVAQLLETAKSAYTGDREHADRSIMNAPTDQGS